MSKKYQHAIFVGRFQPFHNAHLQTLKEALAEAQNIVIVVGSFRTSTTIKNPWSFKFRKKLILKSIPEEYKARVKIVSLRDYMYSETTWITGLQRIVAENTNNKSVALVTCEDKRDGDSYWVKLFPQWNRIYTNDHGVNATEIRVAMYEDNDSWRKKVPEVIVNDIITYMSTEAFTNLRHEYSFIQSYKELWSKAPFPPTFVTTDAVVIQSGHILLVKRKINPGKGKYALPGGFVSQDETIYNAAIRELYEETKILVPRVHMRSSLIDEKVFDHPKRSLRGRTITHAFLFKLEAGELPLVKGGDDAEEAFWIPIGDLVLHEENFFEDHLHIINYFVQGV